jgi:CHAT domain-containing protein
LGDAEKGQYDGILQNHEIFPKRFNADLVTLSSCGSGLGNYSSNEGVLGFFQYFLLSGARSVAISLWQVEDKSTAELFSSFYNYLFEGYSKTESLRLAKIDIMKKYKSPFYWAPFIIVGEA